MKYMKWLFQFDLRARLDGGFKHFLFSPQTLGKMIRSYFFQDGLVIFFRMGWFNQRKKINFQQQQNGCFQK